MRKRFISGLTAVCIVGILITNMITSASASVTAALVGASVAGSLLLGSLFNQMCGGQGYDFTNAFQDAVKLYTDWEEDFDGSAKDPIHPVTKVEIDTSKVNIPDNVNFNSVGGTSADKMLIEMQKAINAGLEDGSIEINFDENGNISMPTTSWCTSVADIYSRLGVYTSKDGTNRSRTYWSLVSPYIETTYDSWSVTVHAYDYMKSAGEIHFYQYAIQNDRLFIFKQHIVCRELRIHCFYSNNTYDTCGDLYKSWIDYFSTAKDYYSSIWHSFEFTEDNALVSMSIGCDETSETCSKSSATSGVPNSCFGSQIFDPNASVQDRGIIQIKNGTDNVNQFLMQAEEGAISSKENHEKIPLTGVENTIGNMGLAGVGAGATKGTVSVNSKTKDITVTNEATKEAELVIEQGNAGDIDTPDVDSITDKFPFSLPFDIYNLVTIFVRDEQKPIFEIPIQTTLDIAGEDYNVDEKIVLDLTQFQLNGVDIIRLFTRTVTYIAFIAFLIKITPHVIKH